MWAYTQDMKLMADDVILAYRRKGFQVRSHPYYQSFPTLAPPTLNARANATIQVNSDSFFVWIASACAVVHDGNHLTTAGLGLKLTELQGGYSIAGDELMPHEAFCGSGQSPYVLGFPFILRPDDRIRAEVIHLAGDPFIVANPETKAVNFNLTLIGIRMYVFPFTRTIIQPEH